MNYIEKVLTQLKERNPGEHEFHQAATEILLTLEPVFKKHPEYEKAALLERFVEPERAILSLDGRQGSSTYQQRLSRTIQQRDRAL